MKRSLLYVIALILLIESKQVFAEYLVTIDSSGSILNSFDVGLADGQYVSFIEADSSGNIWAGRNDTSHYTNQYNPNDMVAKFSATGSEIATVKGPMRNPLCMGMDSNGNIYIGGVPEGGYLSHDRIFKYDAAGNYMATIGIDSSFEYRAIDITSDNRLYATQKNPFLLREYSVEGDLVRGVTSFDGHDRLGYGSALSPDETILWSYQNSNGPGEDFIVAYNLNLGKISQFGLNSFGNPVLWGLDTLSNGNLVARSGTSILEFSQAGGLVNEIDISGISFGTDFQRGFAVDKNDNFIINASVPEPTTLSLLALGAFFAGRKRRN